MEICAAPKLPCLPKPRRRQAREEAQPVIANLQPYADYKESGLVWLGRVPRHWSLKRGKSIFVCIDKRSDSGKEELPTVSSTRGVIPRRTTTVTMFQAASYRGHKLCWPDDLVINSLWAWGCGLGVSKHHGIISSAYGVYRIRNGVPVSPAFIHEVVRSRPFNWELHVRSKGIWISRLQLTDESFLDAPFQLPPPEEQAAIVRFLDYANGRLERAIRAKRKVIALLHEQKQAIIHRAVTRGLPSTGSGQAAPAVPLKPSGIPWLGDIPEHWEVRRNSWLFDERIEKGRKGLPTLVVSLRTGVTEGSDIDEDGRPKRLIADVTDYKFTEQGDIAYNMMRMWQGAVGVVPTNGLVSPAYVVAKPRAGVYSGYFELLFRTKGCMNEINRNSRGIVSDRNRLYWDQFKRLYLPVPPFNEQKQIVVYIGFETTAITTAITRLEREVELLREYRTRLVADVVTGKLDVRPVAGLLPAEPVGPEPAPRSDPEEWAEPELEETE